MDKFKEKSIKNYTSWDMNCHCIHKNAKTKNKLIKSFRRIARKRLKCELNKELNND